MATPRQRSEWKGPIEKYIRKVVLRGRQLYRVQVGGTGRGNRKSKICATLEEALATKRAWLAGETMPAAPGPDPDADVEDVIRHHALALREQGKDGDRTEQVIVALGRLYPGLLATPARAVTESHMAAFVQLRREAGIKDNTIVRDLRALRAGIKRIRPDFVVRAEVFPSEDLTRVRMLPEEARRDVFPYIADQFGVRFARLAELAMLCVCRLSELRLLTRDMVHLPERLLLLPRTKGNPPVPRAVRLTTRAVQLLQAQLDSHKHNYVFGNPRTGEPYTRVHVSRTWRLAARACGLTGFTFHDLRHHAPTVAVNNGANPATLKAMGGWKSDKSVARYAHVLSPTVDHYLALAAGETPDA
jgi:integrase